MQDDQPYVGLVIRHAYLWRDEAKRGQEEGLKARPCVIVRVIQTDDGRQNTFICPITHTPPDRNTASVEIPSQTKARLGLDTERSWIILNEVNQFYWKG